MIPILRPSESAEIDRRSRDRGVTVERLMEAAGRAVAAVVRDLSGGAYGRRALVICGKGNNGGDGLVAARHLERWGTRSTVVLLADRDAMHGEAGTNLARFERAGGRVRPFDTDSFRRELERADVVVDSVFGTGFRGRPDGDHALAIQAVNEGPVPVVSVDIPSGVEGETGAVRNAAVVADVTVTFGALKPGLVFFPGAAHAGLVHVADIGFPADLIDSHLWLAEGSDAAALLPRRHEDTHKRSAGVVLVVAGSRAMTGAAALVATAAYRAGAGLVTVAVPEGILPVVESVLTEATFLPLPQTEEGTISEAAWKVLEPRLGDVDAVAIGPGLTTDPSTAALVHRAVAASPVPLVVDADALNAFAGHPAGLAERRSEALITPHLGEFGRLTGLSSTEVGEDRVSAARKAAAELGCTVLLKGSRTVVAEPDGRAVVNPTGGPFLATAGTGDVLTGTIAAFVAAGVRPADAAMVGAYVHGLAGRAAARDLGTGLMASDVAARIPFVVAGLREER